MTAELSAVVAFASAGVAALISTPIAIAVARRTDFYDRPREYRRHKAPTPFLGGAAVLAGFLIGAAAVGGASARLLVLLACAAGLWLLGTIDDRFAVAPKWRLLAELGAAVALVESGLGWRTSGGGVVDFAITAVWIVGLVNAFNLMDNLDGACGTVGFVSAAGIGLLAAIHGQAALAGLAFALAGACAAFLRWNLAGPAKIFLGDGGSMPIGFLVGALSMATARHLRVGDASVLAAALLAGLPILDTALVAPRRHARHRWTRSPDPPPAAQAALTTSGRDCAGPRADGALRARARGRPFGRSGAECARARGGPSRPAGDRGARHRGLAPAGNRVRTGAPGGSAGNRAPVGVNPD